MDINFRITYVGKFDFELERFLQLGLSLLFVRAQNLSNVDHVVVICAYDSIVHSFRQVFTR